MITYKAAYWFLKEGGVHAELLDFPNVITCAETLRGARRMIASCLEDMADFFVSEGKALPVPNPQLTRDDADLEEPIHLLLTAAFHVKIVPQKAAP